MTARILPPFLVALGVLLSAWPLTALFEAPDWIAPLLATMFAVAVTGVIGRAGKGVRASVIAAQAVVLVVALVFFFARTTLAIGVIPTSETISRFAVLARQAALTIQTSQPPAPTGPGIVMLLTAALGLIYLFCDAVGLTLRRPALAGLGLLMPLLTAVANSDGSLPAIFFVLTAACWLALLAVQDRADLRAWMPTDRGQYAEGRERASLSIALGVAAIVLALGAASVLPHAPARYLADGLGRDGVGRTGVGFSPSAEVLRDLINSDSTPVLTYRTDDPSPEPLRVSVATRYYEGRWYPQSTRSPRPGSTTLAYPELSGAVSRTEQSMQVERTRLQAPYVAAPARLTRLSVTGSGWIQSPFLDIVSVERIPKNYNLTYLKIKPQASGLAAAGNARDPDVTEASLSTGAVTPAIAKAAERITAAADTDFAKATALQNWFRANGNFTYSLQLAPRPPGMSDDEAATSAIDRFLANKQGYCVQFATAMVLMARHLGIPARAVTGFLPGTLNGDTRQVRSGDAHMWPELYFSGAGWVRFEPTPGGRSGAAPDYAPEATPDSTDGATPTTAPTTGTDAPTASAPAGANPQRPEIDQSTGAPLDIDEPSTNPFGWVLTPLLILVLLAFGSLVLPLAARRSRRRERRVADRSQPADAVEARWSHLLDDVGDLGMHVDRAGTLARQHRELTLEALLDPAHDAALARIAAAVEGARYARNPQVDLPALDHDIDAVVHALRQSRQRRVRLAAWLWPTAGRRAVAAWWRRMRTRFGRRRGRAETHTDEAAEHPPAPDRSDDHSPSGRA